MPSGRTQMSFGAFVPQGWKMELAGVSGGAAGQWARCREIALLAEELGYASLWVYDHFHTIPKPSHESVFECWTTIAALAEATTTIRLGQMVGCNSYRSPALLAKITSNVDVISGGRLEWGIGAGWYDNEYRGYGFEFPSPAVRIGMLAESVEIVKAMWSEPDVTYEGKYYKLDGAQCDPKPLQVPHPPVWIGGGGEQLTLRVVARHADRSNFGGKPHEWARKLEILKGHCLAVGRDEAEITKTWSPECVVRETEAELEADLASGQIKSLWGEPAESWIEGNLIGTPEQVCEKLETYAQMGCTYVVPWFSDYPADTTLRLMASHVMPEFRSQ